MNNLSNNNTQDFYVELVRLRGIDSDLTLDELNVLIKTKQLEYKAFGISEQAALATAKRVFKLGSVLPLPSGGEGGSTIGLMSVAEFNDIANTYVAYGYTQSEAVGQLPLVTNIAVGTGTVDLTPPDGPQPVSGGDYNGYVKINGFVEIESSNSMSVSNGEVVIGQAGNYYSSNAWIDVSCSTNTTTLGFLFGIERAGQILFSGRPVGSRGFNGDNRTNISGGGFLNNLQVGDKISVWVASENASDITIYDCNVAINLRSKI